MKTRFFATLAASALLLGGVSPALAASKTAVFAGGCFWSAEKAMESLAGVSSVVSGYAGGPTRNPTYQNHRGHLEVVKVTYDPARVSYAKLLDHFFRNIDPTDAGGQICDRGPSYRTAVFFGDAAEQKAAEAAKARVARLIGKPVATEIRPAATFWMAEAYHQDFAKRNKVRYEAYRIGCGRDRAISAVWAGR
jgi:peptide-methionine (S)-S-oxide reductase